ncbi:MAG: DUF2007 domain-containing protein [Gemmataceae bacterium]|nr:DUF2007 domain-containing protein [Gemmataceae bacterium]
MWKCPKCGEKIDDEFDICWACGTTVDGIEDPHFLDERLGECRVAVGPADGVTPESLVTLVKCSTAAQAHAIRVRLESEGIPVFLFDEYTIAMDWLLSNAIGGVKVQVPEPYLDRARSLLDRPDGDEDEKEAALPGTTAAEQVNEQDPVSEQDGNQRRELPDDQAPLPDSL